MMIRAATLADLDGLDEIERVSFPVPWARETWQAELAREHAHVLVALDPGVVGFCNFWLVAQELHVLAIASHPARRRTGVGQLLLDRAIADARAAHCTLATLEVRRGNVAAIALYERAGFQTVHVRARYYADNDEDALVMTAAI
jgi:ribosomal-protein-alanine N-acetyltransferase